MVLNKRAHRQPGSGEIHARDNDLRHERRTKKSRRFPGFEGVVEAPLQLGERRLGGQSWQRPAKLAVENAHIVQPGNVVGMGMGENDRINASDGTGQHLFA